MISKRTILLVLAAALATVPIIVDASRPNPPCVQAEVRRDALPAGTRVIRRDTAKPHLLRVQAQYAEDDLHSPCALTAYTAFLKVLDIVALGLWACAIVSGGADVREWRRAKRRGRRRRSSRSGSGARPMVRSERDQAD